MTDPLDRATTAINNGQPLVAIAIAAIEMVKSLRDIDYCDQEILHHQQQLFGARR